MSNCCTDGCKQPGRIHLSIGETSNDASYCGASYCSWSHLVEDHDSLVDNFDLRDIFDTGAFGHGASDV